MACIQTRHLISTKLMSVANSLRAGGPLRHNALLCEGARLAPTIGQNGTCSWGVHRPRSVTAVSLSDGLRYVLGWQGTRIAPGRSPALRSAASQRELTPVARSVAVAASRFLVRGREVVVIGRGVVLGRSPHRAGTGARRSPLKGKEPKAPPHTLALSLWSVHREGQRFWQRPAAVPPSSRSA